MRRKVLFPLSLLLLVPACEKDSGEARGPEGAIEWVLEGLSSPESVVYDEGTKHFYVSQVRGGAAEKDGDGWVSKVSPDGVMVTAEWATGLNAPKGMRIVGDTLWVSDIDRVVGIDLKTGTYSDESTVVVSEATFLNDVAAAKDGTLYVSDTLGDAIFKIAKPGTSEVAVSRVEPVGTWDHPNGLLVKDGVLTVASWGSPVDENFATEQPGRLYSVALADDADDNFSSQPVGNLDGVESDGDDGYYVTDWIAGTLHHVDASGRAKLVREFEQGAADLAYFPLRKQIVVPIMIPGKVISFQVE